VHTAHPHPPPTPRPRLNCARSSMQPVCVYVTHPPLVFVRDVSVQVEATFPPPCSKCSKVTVRTRSLVLSGGSGMCGLPVLHFVWSFFSFAIFFYRCRFHFPRQKISTVFFYFLYVVSPVCSLIGVYSMCGVCGVCDVFGVCAVCVVCAVQCAPLTKSFLLQIA
jgi:hypothetical protein